MKTCLVNFMSEALQLSQNQPEKRSVHLHTCISPSDHQLFKENAARLEISISELLSDLIKQVEKMPNGKWIAEDRAKTLYYKENKENGKLDTAYLDDNTLVICGSDLCSILEEKLSTLNSFLRNREKFLLCSKGFDLNKGGIVRRFIKKQDALELIRSVKFNDRDSDLDINDFWSFINDLPEILSPVEDIEFVENNGATYVYKIDDHLMRVRKNKAVMLINTEDVRILCGFDDLMSSPLASYCNNLIKTYFMTRGGQCLQYMAISSGLLMEACEKEDFSNKEKLIHWLEILGEERNPARISVPKEEKPEIEVVYADKPKTRKQREEEFKEEWNKLVKDTVAITRDWEALKLSEEGYKVKSPWITRDFHAPNWEFIRTVIPCLDDVEIKVHPSDAYLWVECPASSRAVATNWKRKYYKFLSDFEGHEKLHAFTKEEFNEVLQRYREANPVSEPGPDDECHNGTVRHNISAALLKSFILKEPMTPEEAMEFSNLVSKEETILDYVRYAVHDFKEQQFEECYIEEHLPLPFLGSEMQGRSDLIFRKPEKLKVIDFKSGEVPVEASNNPQLKIYAYGALANKGINPELKEIELQIIQPSINNYSTITITPRELMDWGRDVLMPRARAAVNPTVDDLHYGDHCKRCPCKDCRLKNYMEER